MEKYKLFFVFLGLWFLTAGLAGCIAANGQGAESPTPENPGMLTATPPPAASATSGQATLIILSTATIDANKTPETIVVSTIAPTNAGTKTDHYKFVGQNYPDNMKVLPGAVLTITWAIKNTGTVGWTPDYTLRYFSGINARNDYYAFPKTVPANGVVNLTVTITAPKTVGKYATWWKLTNPQGQNFGDVDFPFEVSNTPSK